MLKKPVNVDNWPELAFWVGFGQDTSILGHMMQTPYIHEDERAADVVSLIFGSYDTTGYSHKKKSLFEWWAKWSNMCLYFVIMSNANICKAYLTFFMSWIARLGRDLPSLIFLGFYMVHCSWGAMRGCAISACRNTLGWILVLLASHPEVQSKLRVLIENRMLKTY